MVGPLRNQHLRVGETISAQYGVHTASGEADASQTMNDYVDFTEAFMEGDRHSKRVVAYSGFEGSSKKREDETLSMQTPREMRPTLDSGKGDLDHSLEKRVEMHRTEICEDELERLSPSSYTNKANY